jgi:hypothetical protein
MKCVGMQVIAESLALGSFKTMKNSTRDELLRRIVELTAQDEARHVSYGLIYMRDELPKLSEPDRRRVEDFALAALRILAPAPGQGGPLFELLAEVGVDMAAATKELQAKFSDPAFRRSQPNTFQDYVIPQLKRLDLISERTAPGYREMGLEV